MSLVKPSNIQGINASNALGAKVRQFFEFGLTNTEIKTNSSFIADAAESTVAGLGKCSLFTSLTPGVSQDAEVSNDNTILVIYQHNGTDTASVGDAGRCRFFDLFGGDILRFDFRRFNDRQYELTLRGDFSSTVKTNLDPFPTAGVGSLDPHAMAFTVELLNPSYSAKVYLDGSQLSATSPAVNKTFSAATMPVPMMPLIGAEGDTYVSAIVVFNSVLSDAEMASATTDPWAMVSTGPALTVTQATLTPGGEISGTYADYATVPTTLTVSDGTNTITIASPTITDNGDGTGSFSGTMPALPTTGTASLVLFGDVTVELS